MKVGNTTLLKSAPGRRFAMICDSTIFPSSASLLLNLRQSTQDRSEVYVPLPCSGSTTCVSSSAPSDLVSSTEDRLLAPEGSIVSKAVSS